MPANTAVRTALPAVEPIYRDPIPVVESARWKSRYLFSSFRDRRSLREIGGVSAYLTQVGWSLWWILRQ